MTNKYEEDKYIVNRAVQVSAVTVVVVATFCALLFVSLNAGRNAYKASERKTLIEGAKVGWSRKQVIDALGVPNNVAKSSDQLVTDDGYYPAPSLAVESEVLEYRTMFWKLYVYIDKRGRVSNVFLART